MTKYYAKYKKGMKKGKNGKYYYPKKRKYQNNKKRNYRRGTSDMIISKPLLPETQKVCLKYFTRIQINPKQVRSAANQTANNMAFHTFAFNDPFDIDKTHTVGSSAAHTATNNLEDGARDHQPRMYDQYSAFYERITVLGAKVKATFSNAGRVTITTQDAVVNANGQTIEHIENTREVDPFPAYVGFLNAQHYDEAVVAERWDEAREKGETRFRKLFDKDKPQTLVAKWSLNKDKTFRSQLPLDTAHQAPENFCAQFGHSPINVRYCHLFAHPITTTNGVDPGPVDVEVEISQICLLSARKDIAQS